MKKETIVVKNLKTMGMSLKPCTVFTTGKESFEIADDEVEIGLGIHGEPGTHREKMATANEFTEKLFEKVYTEKNSILCKKIYPIKGKSAI